MRPAWSPKLDTPEAIWDPTWAVLGAPKLHESMAEGKATWPPSWGEPEEGPWRELILHGSMHSIFILQINGHLS